ncbi:hypothetical protein GGX14DRAFT_544678 [Mycena pura]|uniref:DUF6533 domain-containing protein n=1 Tax=Mycena pura TaxID=153505 RepID=A0AAD6Y4Y6_9AGAR|nr:hypothetical protein GGX14DRAFT_544678 [Mycena pura]
MEVSLDLETTPAILLQKVKYMNVASMTILVFDYLLSFELEVSLVWGTKWSFSKVFFLCSRYPPFLDVPLQLWYSLTPNMNINTGGTFLGIAMAEVAPPPLSVAGCYLIDGSKIVVVAFILVVFNETVLVMCTLWVGVTRFRHSWNHLIKTLYCDGITYFVFLFLISAGNLAILIWGPLELVDLFNTFLRVMHSVLSTRSVLHVRAAARWELQSGRTSLAGTSAEPIFRIPGTTVEYTVD